MASYIELSANDLKLNFITNMDFATTEEILPYKNIIGQKRAEESIELGLEINKKGYNIFISGRNGTGKTGYIINKIENYAKNLPAPDDWCYVYNFDDPDNPMAIPLETGTAQSFKEDISELLKKLFKEVPAYFNSQSYEKEKNAIVDKYEDEIVNLTEKLTDKAKEKGFNLEQTTTGEFVFVPVLNGKELDTDSYAELTQKEKDDISKTVGELRIFSIETIKRTKKLSKGLEEELKYLDNIIAESILKNKIALLVERHGTNGKVIKYLELLKKDIIENIGEFLEKDSAEKNINKKNELVFRRFDVNVLVCNERDKGAPVIFADSVEYGSLFGKVEYENKLGNLVTDFTLIKPGSLHKANGGYLIIKANQLLAKARSWEALKKCLNLETIFLENWKNDSEALPITTLRPENIPLKTKIILLGSNILYSLLLQHDMDFDKLFKIKAEFDSEIECSEENIKNLLGFISNYVQKNYLHHITKEGINELLIYSSRIAQSRKHFSASMSKLLQIIDMADYFSTVDKSEFIDLKHIRRALEENEAMHGLVRNKILQMYKSEKYIINLKGTSIGQINGLSISNYGDCIVGQQHRITVTTYAGNKGVINIEREANMSGSIHDKGIMILTGYLGELIGQQTQISFNANIVFEQLYSGIEGDSASAAELLALLSSLSGIPLKQSLAITGSVNQKGEIQPIGGVNDKIEGYYDICSAFGLDGSHGVIIPASNLEDLVLSNKVTDSISKGLFHIYAVTNIEECIEILCDGNYRSQLYSSIKDMFKQKIITKLQKYNNVLKDK